MAGTDNNHQILYTEFIARFSTSAFATQHKKTRWMHRRCRCHTGSPLGCETEIFNELQSIGLAAVLDLGLCCWLAWHGKDNNNIYQAIFTYVSVQLFVGKRLSLPWSTDFTSVYIFRSEKIFFDIACGDQGKTPSRWLHGVFLVAGRSKVLGRHGFTLPFLQAFLLHPS